MSRREGPTTGEGPTGWCEPYWHLNPFFLVGCALVVLAAPIWLPLVGPACFVIGRLQDRAERRFHRRMRESGRFIERADLTPSLEAGEGSLVFEQADKRPLRAWWTPDDLLASAPDPPTEDELRSLLIVPSPHPFVTWRHLKYLDEDQGTALLTFPDDAPEDFIFAETFRERYPNIRAVDTVYHRGALYDREQAA